MKRYFDATADGLPVDLHTLLAQPRPWPSPPAEGYLTACVAWEWVHAWHRYGFKRNGVKIEAAKLILAMPEIRLLESTNVRWGITALVVVSQRYGLLVYDVEEIAPHARRWRLLRNDKSLHFLHVVSAADWKVTFVTALYEDNLGIVVAEKKGPFTVTQAALLSSKMLSEETLSLLGAAEDVALPGKTTLKTLRDTLADHVFADSAELRDEVSRSATEEADSMDYDEDLANVLDEILCHDSVNQGDIQDLRDGLKKRAFKRLQEWRRHCRGEEKKS